MLSPGQTVDRWVVDSVLGEGAMATVYLVRHLSLGTLAALKVLAIHHRTVEQRFLAEGRAQAGLRHPNVVGVLDVLTVDDTPALLLEYVAGPTLEQVLERGRPTLEEAERIFRGVVAGVSAAHAAGLVHRDLKPGNILMDGTRPRIADFGLAKPVGEDRGLTRTGAMMGTPAYVAPEQVRDAKSVDERADLFSLGCILYHLCTGKPPFDGPSAHDILQRVITGDYEPPERRVHVPDRIVRTIRACLVTDPAGRPADCAAVLRLLDGDGTPDIAPPMLWDEAPTAARAVSVDTLAPPATVTPVARVTLVPPDPSWYRAFAAGFFGTLTLVGLLAAGAVVGGAGATALGETAAAAPMLASPAAIPARAALPSRVAPIATVPLVGALTSAEGASAETAAPPPTTDGTRGSLPRCRGAGRVGWAVAVPFLLGKGDLWKPMVDKKVYADRPRDGRAPRTVCLLPKGTHVRLREEPVPVGGSGTWIPVYLD